jgi:Protein of unknown function (DUF4019)
MTGLVLTTFFAFAAVPKPEVGAQTAAEKWLALVDEGQYVESWQILAAKFKEAVSKRKWKSTIAEIRSPLGKVVSRKLTSAEYTKDLPGAPEGEYVVLTFDTNFQNKTNAVETVTPVLGMDLIWRVSGYSVK